MNSQSDENTNVRIKSVTELLISRMSQVQSYHNHKETMAHAGLVVQLVLLTAIIGASNWPPSWIPDWCISGKQIAVIGITLIWLLIHIYMRWQLRQRRFAALFVKSAVITLREWANNPPSNEGLSPAKSEPWNISWLPRYTDHLIPCKRAKVPTDEGLKGYPTDFVNAINTASTGALFGEWLVWFGSLIILSIMLFRTLS